MEIEEVVAAIIVVVIVAVICVVIGYFMCRDVGFDSGTGQQIGYISEVEYHGWLWKTTEIKLISVEPTYSSSDTVWYYATPDNETTAQARQFMKTHDKVIVEYETRQMVPLWEFSHRVIITNITKA